MSFLKAISLFIAATCLILQSGCTQDNKEAIAPETFAPGVEDPFSSSDR